MDALNLTNLSLHTNLSLLIAQTSVISGAIRETKVASPS